MKLISLLIFVFIIGGVSTGAAQTHESGTGCKAGQTASPIGSWTWAQNTHVDVFVRVPDFSVDEVPSLLKAIQNWDASYIDNGSGVRFEYKGTVTGVMICDGCLTIMRGATSDKRHGAELQAISRRMDQVINHARIVINWSYTKHETLTAILAHEIGHSLGLMDCPSCKRGSTVMGSFGTTLKLLNIRILQWSNGIEGPTPCDRMQVRLAYEMLRKAVQPAPNISGSQIVDEGEEPEEDDTPVILP